MRLVRKRKRGFTLLEVLVVMAIITLLAALLVVLVTGVKQKAREEKTRGTIKKLCTALSVYRERFQDFPPSAGAYQSSQNLHYYLCNRFRKPEGIDPNTGRPTWYSEPDPPLTLTNAEVSTHDGGNSLQPGFVVDAWDLTMFYFYPGRDHRSDSPAGPDHRSSAVGGGQKYDIASRGRNNNWSSEENLASWIDKKVKQCGHYSNGDFP